MIVRNETKLFLFVKKILNRDFKIKITQRQLNGLTDLLKSAECEYIDNNNVFRLELFIRHLIRICIFS